jgi:fructosamine-3-kinase
VQECLRDAGLGEITGADPVGGGCINETLRIVTAGGESAFLKWNGSAPRDFFPAEVRGLEALRRVAEREGITGLRVPRVLGSGAAEGPAWVLLEFVRAGPPTPEFWRALGSGLAQLHGAPPPPGLDRANYIGPLEQDNPSGIPWAGFWIEQRLEPQLRLAVDAGHFAGRSGEAARRFLDRAGDLLPDLHPDQLALIHGDLWSGNVFPDGSGRAVLVDPAVYAGDPRVDLAMTELFGGFAPGFRAAYDTILDPGPEYAPVLRDLYQLYPLLVHVNLFGESYVPGFMERVGRLSRP